jgi:hypothetical protein
VKPQPGLLVNPASTLAGVFGRIALPYDDSPAARRALHLAKTHHAELIAVAVEAHLPHYGGDVLPVDTAFRWGKR